MANRLFLTYTTIMVTKEESTPQASTNNSGVGLAHRIAAEIRRRVTSGELPLGTWLRQDNIAEEFQTSRTPVREAFQLLSATGTAELIRNRGARIRVPTAREIQDGYRVRAELEGLAAELATRFATQQQIDEMKNAEQLFEQAVEEAANPESDLELGRLRWSQANDTFHEVILDAARNQSLVETLDWLHNQLPRNLTWTELSRDVRLMRGNIHQHRAIREAIEQGEGAAARAAMIEHVTRSAELVLIGLAEME